MWLQRYELFLKYQNLQPNILLYYQQVVILLALLSQKILAVNQILGCNSAVLIGDLFLVQRYTSALNHLAHFAL